ncbi:hypothetical protein SAMN02746041_01163 [Desulfacinum hydrothermale DSM 13146]|uniref:Uncharacterized protein n=1 Tax=Desulfacinum hydrothermale DSM 13146 TaxID=1121390 RepID=A0A1W1XCS3_9BACT|nr:hypothetical protein SAMN02746041_01163 [Desulfacinum hydrothermale DSM 13146]
MPKEGSSDMAGTIGNGLPLHGAWMGCRPGVSVWRLQGEARRRTLAGLDNSGEKRHHETELSCTSRWTAGSDGGLHGL